MSSFYFSIKADGILGLCYAVSHVWKSSVPITYTNPAHAGNRHGNCEQNYHLGSSEWFASVRMLFVSVSAMRKCRCTLRSFAFMRYTNTAPGTLSHYIGEVTTFENSC